MSSIVLAENGDTGIMAVLMVVSGLVSGGATWLTNYLMVSRKSRRAEYREDETNMVGQLEKLNTRLEQDRKEAISREIECQKKFEKQGLELTEVKIESSRAVEWIKNYEFQMKNANVPYRSWNDTHVPFQVQVSVAKPGEQL